MAKIDNPTKDWEPDMAINHVCCELTDLRNRDDLTEVEKALVYKAWNALSDAQVTAMRRLNPHLFKDEKPAVTADKLHS